MNEVSKLIDKTITEAVLDSTVTTIGQYAFSYCYKLTSVIISDSVTSIGGYAFYRCTSLSSITIPDSVIRIGSNAFQGCASLTSVTVNATNPPTLTGAYAFDNTNNCPIYVPASSVDTYKTATNWSTYADRIQAIPS